jgi:hypothetical protein
VHGAAFACARAACTQEQRALRVRVRVRRWRPPCQVRDLKKVLEGQSTDLLRRKGKASNKDLYFSLVTASRDLNFEAASKEERDWFVAGFRAIVQGSE